MSAGDADLATIAGATRLCHWFRTVDSRGRRGARRDAISFVSTEVQTMELSEYLHALADASNEDGGTPPQIIRFGEEHAASIAPDPSSDD